MMAQHEARPGMLTLASRGGGPPPDPANRGPGLQRTAKLLALESVRICSDNPESVSRSEARGCAITAVTAATAFTAQSTHAAAEGTDQDQDIRHHQDLSLPLSASLLRRSSCCQSLHSSSFMKRRHI